MSVRRIVVDHDFAIPADRAYAYLSEHEHFGIITPMKVERIRDGDQERNGAGSCRRVSLAGLLPFEETVTRTVPDEYIAYQVTKGSPLRDHHAELRFTPTGSGSHLRWEISFRPAAPGLGAPLALALRRAIERALRIVDVKAA